MDASLHPYIYVTLPDMVAFPIHGMVKIIFSIYRILVAPLVNWCVRRGFLKKSMQNRFFFTAYRPKMAQIDKNGLKVTHLKSKDRFSA